MERYQRKFEESFNPGDKVKMIKGRYKNFIGTVIEEFMPGWYTVEFLDKATKGKNSYTDVREIEIEKYK